MSIYDSRVMGWGPGWQGWVRNNPSSTWFPLPAEKNIFFLLLRIQLNSGVHPTYCALATGAYFAGNKLGGWCA